MRPLFLLLPLLAACASPKPVSADETHATAASDTSPLNRHIRAAPADAAPCTSEPAGRPVSDLKEADVGTEVTIEGELALAGPRCTAMKCEASPCCNSCGGFLVLGGAADLKGGVLLKSQAGSPLNCGGNECQMTCPGFAPGNRYRVFGKLLEKPFPGGNLPFAFDVMEVCRRVEKPAGDVEE